MRFSPRFGATYSLSDEMVVRGGYGLFYAPWNYNTSNHGQIGFTRRTQLNQISNDDTGVPITTLENPFPERVAATVRQLAGPAHRHGRELLLCRPDQG